MCIRDSPKASPVPWGSTAPPRLAARRITPFREHSAPKAVRMIAACVMIMTVAIRRSADDRAEPEDRQIHGDHQAADDHAEEQNHGGLEQRHEVCDHVVDLLS